MKLNQVVERGSYSGPRIPDFTGVNSENIKSSTYGGENLRFKKVENKGRTQQPSKMEVNKVQRNSRASTTTYGTGMLRSGNSGSQRWAQDVSKTDPRSSEPRKFAHSNLERADTRDISLKSSKNLISDIHDRRKSLEKQSSEKQFIKTIIKNNRLKPKYGENDLSLQKSTENHLTSDTRNPFTNHNLNEPHPNLPSQSNFQLNSGISSSATHLNPETVGVRREEKFSSTKSQIGTVKKIVDRERGFCATMDKTTYLGPMESNPRTPDGEKVKVNPNNEQK